MIQANKADLLTCVHLGSTEVRYMEIEYFLMVFAKLTAIAGLLAGFASTALISETEDRRENYVLHIVYILSTGAALGLMLLVLLISTLCTLWAPGLALRGNGQNALNEAVNIMEKHADTSFRYFVTGLGCYLFSSILSTWILFSFSTSIIASTIIGSSMYLIYHSGREVIKDLSPPVVVTGFIRGNPLGAPQR